MRERWEAGFKEERDGELGSGYKGGKDGKLGLKKRGMGSWV